MALLLVKSFSSGISGTSASSPESRAEVADVAMAASLVLTGLTWVALEPSVPPEYPLDGNDIGIATGAAAQEVAPIEAIREAEWAHSALVHSSKVQSTLVLYRNQVLIVAGPRPVELEQLNGTGVQLGNVCKSCADEGKQAYLPSLAAYPARAELAGLVPTNTQCVAMHAVGQGDDGLLLVSAGAERAFSEADRAFIAAISNKLSTTIAYAERAHETSKLSKD